MSILIGHPTGNPNSHHAAVAHLEAGRLEAFCVPWMPRTWELELIRGLPGLRAEADRLSRRAFAGLRNAPLVEGRTGEWWRMARRLTGKGGGEGLSYEANDWLMRTMKRECHRPAVTAVHAYEDCSLWQFEEAQRLGKACIYDMPIGLYSAWEETQRALAGQFADWLGPRGLPSSGFVRPVQKRREMELADLVLAPGSFVENTIRTHYPKKQIARAAYGVDSEFWRPRSGIGNDEGPVRADEGRRPLRFVYAGQQSLRKGTPVLLQAWKAAALRDAELHLIGLWTLSESKKQQLPPGVVLHGPVSAVELRAQLQSADVFVFPSFFEGFGLVVLEAMACGLPVIATTATVAPDILDESTGKVLEPGDLDALVDALRLFDSARETLPAMGRAARTKAQSCSWDHYRSAVSAACARYR